MKAEKLYTALIGYIWYEAPEGTEELHDAARDDKCVRARAETTSFQNPVDLMFERLEEKDRNILQSSSTKKYKLARQARPQKHTYLMRRELAPFDIKELRGLWETDEMEKPDTIGDRKTALFVIISDTDDTFNCRFNPLHSYSTSCATRQMMNIRRAASRPC